MPIRTLLVLLPFLIAAAPADPEQPKRPIRTGQFTATFADRSPDSAIETIARRVGWPMSAITRSAEPNYDLADESFEVTIPSTYRDDQSWGLLVWVSPGPECRLPPAYYPLLARHKLLVAGPNKAHNERASWIRVGLAIDAASNMQRQYRLDDRRIYIGGLSGGGRISSITAGTHPQLFHGGYYVIGCNFYRDVAVPDQPGRMWPGSFKLPAGNLLADVRTRSRHILLTGDTDANMPEMKAYSAEFARDGFKHVHYLQVPGMGHTFPPTDWFEKGLVLLDTPPADQTPSPPKPDSPATQPTEQARAQSLLNVAKLYMTNNRPRPRETPHDHHRLPRHPRRHRSPQAA